MASKGCRLTIVPRDLESQLAFFEGKVDHTEKAGQRPGGTPQSNATLERRLPDGRWERIWSRALVNDVAPVDALVSDGMDYVVTFDNWHSIGYGDDAIVIYDIANGGVRTFSVEKLLGTDYFAALPHSVSSVQWRGDKRIEGGQLVIDVVVPDESRSMGHENHVKLAIDLASGKTTERSPGAWRGARTFAERVNAASRAAEQANRAERGAPLPGPASHDVLGWHSYLREAFWRVDPDWIEGSPATTVLLARRAPNYRDSVKWIGKHLEESGGGPEMFAGVDEADLMGVLTKVTARLRPGALHGKQVYIAASQAVHARLTALFAPSRATLVLLDPARPIPQRPERLPRADGSLPTPFDFRKSEDSP
ncbi:hypothetical protein CVN68_18150 [Sphingomonas psychrotolerans]|uniref:Uncharacterized protein n=1 Tax=Sphingomonas psychrotolerans TaxID=1327635 RepID=A0A2K8MID3_9SPHN|nr:hypothetical protein CVN68_18150 [Sphingomonas psychrotolerans]